MFFSKFERLVARRYLKAKRREGFISVITGFAFTDLATHDTLLDKAKDLFAEKKH